MLAVQEKFETNNKQLERILNNLEKKLEEKRRCVPCDCIPRGACEWRSDPRPPPQTTHIYSAFMPPPPPPPQISPRILRPRSTTISQLHRNFSTITLKRLLDQAWP